jgi:hypothetical protein
MTERASRGERGERDGPWPLERYQRDPIGWLNATTPAPPADKLDVDGGIAIRGVSFVAAGCFEASGPAYKWRRGILGRDAIPAWASHVYLNHADYDRLRSVVRPDEDGFRPIAPKTDLRPRLAIVEDDDGPPIPDFLASHRAGR